MYSLFRHSISRLNVMLQELSCIIVLQYYCTSYCCARMLKFTYTYMSVFIITHIIRAFWYCICCNFTHIYSIITWLSPSDCA